MDLITGLADTEHLVLQYVDPATLLNYAAISKTTNKFVKTNKIYKLVQLFIEKCGEYDYERKDNSLVMWALENSHNCIYEWLEKSNFDFVQKVHCLNIHSIILKLSGNDIINGLTFLYKYYSVKNFDVSAIMIAVSRKGDVNVLQWIKDNGFVMPYNYLAIEGATKNGHVSVLDWFKKNGLLEYARDFEKIKNYSALKYANHNIVTWWNNNGVVV